MSVSFKQLAEISNQNIDQKTIEELIMKNMDNITWLDLYNFLYNKANDIKNIGTFDWSSKVTVIEKEKEDEQ